MKKMKKVLAFMMAITCVAMFNIGNGNVVKAAEKSVTASQAYVDAMQPGWNLGNTFDGYDTNGDRGEESWGNPKVTKELIHNIKEQGFKSIRMPFTTVMRTGEAPDYTIDPTFLARYAEVVNWALDEGLYVMINVHHDSWNWAKNIGTDDGSAMKQYQAIWRQLADYFKDYPETVCFESLNEPQFNGSDAAQIAINNQVNEACYEIVRNSGGNNATRMLVLPTLNTNDSEDRCESLYNSIQKLNDPNIIATFHYYGPWAFSVNIAGRTTFDDWVQGELEGAFDRMYNAFTSKGIGVICGEYGLLGFDTALGTIEEGEMLKYMEYLGYYANQKDITMMLWDNGQHFSRYNYTWSDQDLFDMIKASWETRSSYTESDHIFIKKGTTVSDVTQKLSLNGNTLVSINDGSKELVLGEDYTATNEAVTIKASYLNSILTSTYGTQKTLTFKFSQGADWKVYVEYYNRAVMSDAQGTTSGLAIPVSYKGDIVETMEAVDANGSGVGPQNWTTYKEYAKTFAPDYTNNTLTIKDAFFAETNDGEITLKVHFLSGEVVNYKVVKSGNTVTGKALETDDEDNNGGNTGDNTGGNTGDGGDETVAGISVTQSGNANNTVFSVEIASKEQVDLSKVAVRYYFTKADTKEMNFWCDNAGLALKEAPWYMSIGSLVKYEFVQTNEGYYLEITMPEVDAKVNEGTLTLQTRIANMDWSNMENLTAGVTEVYYNGSHVK